ncbi:permease [Carboxylicivirga caseinilyticus]|uniref:permease n=1 Tax=Carboxylicivirga caseinilyticus TaxID=3417572 RepID=UPI003D35952E|nr:permease [Marinilabiliaceae bacterium A049]
MEAILTYTIDFFNSLFDLLKAMSPYLLLGFFFAGILKVWFPQSWIDRFMGKSNLGSVVNTAILGIPLPLCSCGVIPTGISFYRNGASKGSSVSFLISTPQTGVDSIMVTYSLLGLPFAIIRVIVALITGVLGGVATNTIAKDDKVDASKSGESCESDKMGTKQGWKGIFRYGFYEFLMDIAKWLVIGILIAAVLAVLIPDDFFANYLDNEPLSMLIILLASVPLYLCATASVPIAAVLMLKGLSPGAALVLLMAGPATNAATITIIQKVFGLKTLISYLGSIILGAMVFGTLINAFLPREWFTLAEHAMHEGHRHELLPEWFQLLSAITLIALIVNGYIQKYLKKQRLKKATIQTERLSKSIIFNNNNKPSAGAPVVPVFNTSFTMAKPTVKTTYIVEGMTCSHCKMSVEKNLGKLDGIASVEADPQSNRVIVEASEQDNAIVESTIESLGYSYKGLA